jgi:superfamily II DNA/RNA helicase
VSIGESGKVQPTHIVVASPGFLKKNLEGRGSSLNLEPIRLVCFDEVDELFNN